MKTSRRQLVSSIWRIAVVSALPSALLLTALIVVVVEAPWPIRVLAAPVLVVVPGAALVSNLFPHREDAALRWSLIVVSGLLSWLVVALVVNVAGASVTPSSLAMGVCAVGLLATVAGHRRRFHSDTSIRPGGMFTRPRPDTRIAAAVAGSVVVLSSALVVAGWIQPDRREVHTSLVFTDAAPFAEGREVVAAGAPTRLNWALRGYGVDLSASVASLRLTVDGVALDDVAVDVNPSTTPDVANATSTILGAVTFAAPHDLGRHVVALTIVPAAGDGTPAPEPGFISTVLEVQ